MKIVCESCGAKYSIADDRVTGKVFKIRCKRCSEVIIVRGDQQAQQAEEPASAASPNDGNAIWHIVVDGEQAGPYSPQQLGEMLTAQTVDWDAYVWTEGFDNWLPMREVTDLVSQITGQGAQAQAAPQQAAAGARAAAYRSAVHETLSGQPSMGADPFADDSAANEPGLFGNGGASSGPDLFAARGAARAAASPFAGGDDAGVVASAPSPRMGAEQAAMTGARNENSVLFSLKNLQALATGSGGASLPPATVSAGSTGYASGEGSGLIDIRALATTTGMGENSGGGGARDELLSIGGAGGGAFGSLGSPMLAPVAAETDNKKVWLWAGVGAIAIMSTAAVAIAYVMRAPPPQAPPVAMLPQAAPANTVAAAQPTSEAAPAPADKPSEGELAARAAAASAEPSQPRERSGSSDHGESRRRREKGEDNDPAPAAAAPEKPAAPSKPSGPRSIDDLLDGALSGSSSSKGGKPAEASASKSNLAETPSRDQVMSAMNGVKSAVQACGGGGGVAMVNVSVAGETGRVTNAQVSGVTGPAGSCIAQAVRKAQFPKFQNKVFKVQFPFKL